jgi:vitamin B12 transporter
VYGNNETFSINPSYQLKKVKIFANLSSGYRVPSLYQLYSEFGNTNLKPERSLNYEAGLQYNDKNLTLRAVGFKRDIKDIILFYSDPFTFESKYLNKDKQKDFGLELEAAWMLGKKITLSANYAYVDGKLQTKDVSGKDSSLFNLYRRPKNICNLQIDYQLLKGLTLGLQLRIAGAIYEPKYAAEPVQLSNYYTLDIYAAYQTGKHLKFFTDFRNITDQKYFDQEGFSTRRFNLNAGILLNY